MRSKAHAVRRLLVAGGLHLFGCAEQAALAPGMVSEAVAVETAKKAVATSCALIPVDQYEITSVEVRDRAYNIVFNLKKKSMGGMIEMWISGQTGGVVAVHCYQ